MAVTGPFSGIYDHSGFRFIARRRPFLATSRNVSGNFLAVGISLRWISLAKKFWDWLWVALRVPYESQERTPIWENFFRNW